MVLIPHHQRLQTEFWNCAIPIVYSQLGSLGVGPRALGHLSLPDPDFREVYAAWIEN